MGYRIHFYKYYYFKEKNMADNKEPTKGVDFKEIIISNMFEIEAIVETLEEKGIMTRKDYMEKINRMKEQRNRPET